jgi:hypothetical protein
MPAAIIRCLPKLFCAALLSLSVVHCKKKEAPPPNAPATISGAVEDGSVALNYRDGVIAAFDVRVDEGGVVRLPQQGEVELKVEVAPGGPVEQRVTFALANPDGGARIVLDGRVTGSTESFPAESGREAQETFAIVRNSVGLSRNLRNDAIYDRKWDWQLAAAASEQTRILPVSEAHKGNTFSWQSSGATIELVFRPLFYQQHKNLKHFEPWAHPIHKESISGWCSWWAYRTGFTQKELEEVLAVFDEKRLRD